MPWRGYASDQRGLFSSHDGSLRQVILIGPRAHTRLWMRPIMSAQDARGPMSMIWQGRASVQPGRSSLCSASGI